MQLHDLDISNTTPSLTRFEAMRMFVDHPSLQGLGVRFLECSVDRDHAIVWWSVDVFDPYADPDQDQLGFATFAEHWPVIDITWA